MISDSEFTDALFCSVAVEKRALFIGKNTFASGKLKLLTNIQSLLFNLYLFFEFNLLFYSPIFSAGKKNQSQRLKFKKH